jgi:leader peptidase (prepilin peptidase)/N-methyltransferase
MPEALLAAAFGLLIGSFLNVCIYRWPRDLSVVHPRSRCPECDTPIAWFDNIPVLSYALLGGRCRHCRHAIPLRYPIVELLTAVCFGWFVYRFGVGIEAARWCVFSALLITLGFADAETRILPDEFTLGGTAAGLLLALVSAVPDVSAHGVAWLFGVTPPERLLSLGEALLGAIVPSGALWLGGVIFARVRHKEGLGFGDVKMTAMLGAFLGLRGALLTLAIGSTLGSVIGLAYLAITRKDAASYELPLGTFLAAAGLIYAFFGQQLSAWYAGL